MITNQITNPPRIPILSLSLLRELEPIEAFKQYASMIQSKFEIAAIRKV